MARRARKAAKRTKPKSGGADWREQMRARLEAEEARLSPKERAARSERFAAAVARVPSAAALQRALAEARLDTLPPPVTVESLREVAPGDDGRRDLLTLPVDDEYAVIARGLSNNARSVLRFLLVVTAFDRASCYDLSGIATDLELSHDSVRSARREIGAVSPKLLESARGRGNGVWLSPGGKLVAERIPPSSCRQACLVENNTKKHEAGAG